MSEISEAAAVLGRIKTKKKALSSKKNGCLGGRPKKKATNIRRRVASS
jgi:hypothetical protein